MLRDEDRIFKNIYGFEGADIASAKARGDWDGTAELIKKGRDWVIDEVKASGSARARWRGFPDRSEMVIHAERK
jgi:NADH-quinone oxidoreductase subunit F